MGLREKIIDNASNLVGQSVDEVAGKFNVSSRSVRNIVNDLYGSIVNGIIVSLRIEDHQKPVGKYLHRVDTRTTKGRLPPIDRSFRDRE